MHCVYTRTPSSDQTRAIPSNNYCLYVTLSLFRMYNKSLSVPMSWSSPPGSLPCLLETRTCIHLHHVTNSISHLPVESIHRSETALGSFVLSEVRLQLTFLFIVSHECLICEFKQFIRCDTCAIEQSYSQVSL